jgi:aminopeptidase YwaD
MFVKTIVWIILLATITPQFLVAQRKKKRKKSEVVVVDKFEGTLNHLKKHVYILSADSMEGRRTSTPGEQMAISYIKSVFENYGILPLLPGGYFQTFDIADKKEFEPESKFSINGVTLTPNKDYFPLDVSADGTVSAITSVLLKTPKEPWYIDINETLVKEKNNPHFDVTVAINSLIANAMKQKPTAIFLYNSGNLPDGQSFNTKPVMPNKEAIPIVYLNKEVVQKFHKNSSDILEVELTIKQSIKYRQGTNVVASINNNAEKTVVIGAHFDHLGYGEDRNSMYTGAEKLPHNGADDNASGTAAILELARLLKLHGNKNYNYTFVAFSGEELGLYGSKYFVQSNAINTSKVQYMINLDMVGRLNDTKTVTIGGYGTAPEWADLLTKSSDTTQLKYKIDSSGSGPSDHTSFYRANIPVLFYFTGIHGDYHKPSDDAEKINFDGELAIVKNIFNVVKESANITQFTFTKTREVSNTSSSTRFSVSLGVMPDYTYTKGGVRIDGVSEGKIAQKIGLKAGDVLTKLGEYPINDVDSYMKALSKFKKGDSTVVEYKRGETTNTLNVSF